MKKKLAKIASLALVGMLCTGIAANSAFAEEEKPTADFSVSVLSQYIWRGWEFSNDSIVIMPSMTVGYKGFAANVWGNLDTDLDEDIYGSDTNDWNETDFTLSYDGSAGMVGYSLGYIYYSLDGAGVDTQELYASASLDTLLAPTLTVYRDIDSAPAWYVTFGISHSIPVSEYSLDLGAQISYYSFDDESDLADPDDASDAYSALHDGILSASMTFPVGEYFSITPEIYYSFPLSSESEDRLEMDNDYDGDASIDGDDDFIYGGVTLSMSF